MTTIRKTLNIYSHREAISRRCREEHFHCQSVILLLCVIAGFPAPRQTPQMDVKTEIAVIKTEIKNINEKIDDKFRAVDDKFASLEKNFDRLNNIIIACIGIPLAILAIGATVRGILASRPATRATLTFSQPSVL